MHVLQMILVKLQFYEQKRTSVSNRTDSCYIKKQKKPQSSAELPFIFKPQYTTKDTMN